ncbi:MAG: hypothetical protein Q7U02_01480, partial [Desulfosalsimonadaceae bacterium]|nr:hypothetical protein [Desulfosalsimonadaceae bacterium]
IPMEQPDIKNKKLYAVVLDMLLLNPKYRSSRKKKKFNAKQKLFVLLLDMIVLTELAGSMYWSQQFGESMPPMFLKIYLPIVLTTLIIGKFCLNRLAHRETAPDTLSIEHSH